MNRRPATVTPIPLSHGRRLLVRGVVYTHRWLGILGCLLFLSWFASGIVLMYARMPTLSAEERLARLPPLDVTRVLVSPSAAARAQPGPPRALRLGMYGGRPLYRFATSGGAAAVFADSGDTLAPLTGDEARAVATAFSGSPPRRVTRLARPDQWTLDGTLRPLFPLFRLALDDGPGTELYVSGVTAEPVLATTRSGRTWGYLGAVLHWLYFTPLRRDGALWANVVIYVSLAGCLLCLSGLVWGVWRLSPSRRYRIGRQPSATPYAGMMRWHHYAGLLFGLTTFTWMFSGLLSMDPWDWHPADAPSRAQREAVAGGPFVLDGSDAAAVRRAAGRIAELNGAREVEFVRFDGSTYLLGRQPPPAATPSSPAGDSGSVLVPTFPLAQALVALGDGRSQSRFSDAAIERAAARAMPGVAVKESAWLDAYDAYYYDRAGGLALPVLRVTYADAVDTALYLDPRRGTIVLKEERWSRVNRWLYHGLHSFDFPFLYWRRPLWDILLVILSVGGVVSTATAVSPAWRRLRRLLKR